LGLLAGYPEEYTVLALSSHQSCDQILAAEEAQFGMTHCRAGALLAKAWLLPDPIEQAAAEHHQSGPATGIVGLIRLSCRLADDFQFQAIHRLDIQKPEDTVTAYAPDAIQEAIKGRLKHITAAVINAIETFDF
jgi:HD-like signal output (HDOD) protein